jgi:hypothetical protein
MWFDIHYMMFALPGMILAIIATIMTRVRFERYSRVRAAS